MASRRTRFAARARAVGRAAASPRSSFMQTVAGAAAYFVHKVGADNIGFIRDNWYAGPVVIAVGGHLVKRTRFREVGAALCGAAGYAGALAFKARESAKQQGGETAMLNDVGAFVGRELPDNTATAAAPALETGDYGGGYDAADLYDSSEAMGLQT